MRSCRSSMKLLREAASPHCPGVDSVVLCCFCLGEPCSTLRQSTFVCPSVVDEPPCSPTAQSCGWWSVGVDAAVSAYCAPATVDCFSSLSWCCVRARALLPPRRVALDVASVDVRLSVARGCASFPVQRAVMRLVVRARGCVCVGTACSGRVRRWVCVMVLLLSRRLVSFSAAINGCLSVGR